MSSRRIENSESYLLGMNTGDLEIALQAFAEDATYYGIQKIDGRISRRLHNGKDEIRAYIGDWLRTASGGVTYKIHGSREFGDGVLVLWEDEAIGDNESYKNEGMMIFEFHDDDTIKHARGYQPMGPLAASSFLKREH
jgi:ketosteroid isomerase-like protein